MSELWHLDAAWWTIVLRTALIYAALLIFIRLSGKRTVGEFTPFDLVVLILIGEGSQNGLIGNDHSVSGALLAAATLISINKALGWVTSRSPKLERIVDGEPDVLARHGKVLVDALRRHNISASEFDETLRANKCTIDDVAVALLEVDGEITVIKHDERVPFGHWDSTTTPIVKLDP